MDITKDAKFAARLFRARKRAGRRFDELELDGLCAAILAEGQGSSL